MPLARIITQYPQESEELRRQLLAAGYSVKFSSPDEEFNDADLIVAAANVHSDYALQYASEVASIDDAPVIVASGLAPGSVAQPLGNPSASPDLVAIRSDIPAEKTHGDASQQTSLPQAGVLFGTISEVKSALSESSAGARQSLGSFVARIGNARQHRKQKRELDREQKRLESERREAEREARQREMLRERAAIEAQMAAERERLRTERAAEEERRLREQEEARRARAAVEAQMAAEQERRHHEQEETRRTLEAERARIAAEAERVRVQREEAAREAVVITPQAPVLAPIISEPRPLPRHAPVAQPSRPRSHRRPARRTSTRDRRFRRAAVIASVVAVAAMLGLAAARNMHPTPPIPHSMVQNPVQEERPFGAAHITPKPAAAVATPVPRTSAPQPAAAPVSAPPKPSPKPPAGRVRRSSGDDYVAQDEVIIHHYGVPAKHPPSTQTRASIPKYSDQQ